MKANIELKQARDFGEIISDCILFIRQNWKSLIKTYFVFCGFFVVGNMLFSILLHMRMISHHAEQLTGNIPSRTIFGLDYFMVLIFSFLNGVSAILCLLSYITLYNEQGKQAPTINQVWGYYKYYFWRIIGHTLLLCIILILGIFAIAIPLAFIFNSSGTFIVALLFIVGIFVPLIYFMTIFSLFFPIVIIENGSFGYAFGKCFKLVRGKWWSTFGVVFVIAIIIYAGFLLVIVPFSVAAGGLVTILSYNLSVPAVILYTVLLSLLQVLNILPFSATAIMYFSYVEDKEGTGLFERIGTIGTVVEDIDPANEEY